MKKLIVVVLLCLSAMGMAQELSKDAVIEIGVVGTAKNFRIRTYFGPDQQNPAQDITWERLSGNRVAFIVVPTQEYMVSKEGFKVNKIKLSPKDPLFATYGSTFSNFNEFEQWAEDSLGESDGGSPGNGGVSRLGVIEELKILTSKSVGKLFALSETSPTITLEGGYTQPIGNSKLIIATDTTRLNYTGSIPNYYDPSGPGISFAYASNVIEGADGRNSGGKKGWVMRMNFVTDADEVSIPILADNTINIGYRIIVNGNPLTRLAQRDLPSYNYQQILIDFGSSETRNITLEFEQYVGVGGVKVNERYSVYKNNIPSLKAVIIGDSYTSGTYGDGTAYSIDSYSNQLSELLGLDNLINSSEGGIGYIKDGSLSSLKAIEKLDEGVTVWNPDLIIGALGYNDAFSDATQLQTAITVFWQKVVDDNPDAICIAIGPYSSGSNQSQINSLKDNFKNGVENVNGYGSRLFYIDTVEKEYFTGTGRVGNTSATGNTSLYIGADNVHLTQNGHDYLANRVYQDIKSILTSI